MEFIAIVPVKGGVPLDARETLAKLSAFYMTQPAKRVEPLPGRGVKVVNLKRPDEEIHFIRVEAGVVT